MSINREAFVKNWWSNYQVQYALIESPERRIQYLDRLLPESERFLFTDEIKAFILETRDCTFRTKVGNAGTQEERVCIPEKRKASIGNFKS